MIMLYPEYVNYTLRIVTQFETGPKLRSRKNNIAPSATYMAEFEGGHCGTEIWEVYLKCWR